MSSQPVIIWFRNDLRLHDHPALVAAAKRGPVLPVFIHDVTAMRRPLGAAACWWLHESLAALSTSLTKLGVELIIRHGPTANVLSGLIDETGACGVYFSRAYDPDGRVLEESVVDRFKNSVEVKRYRGSLLLQPEDVLTKSGTPYRVFTPFWNNLRDRIVQPQTLKPPAALAACGVEVASDGLAALRLQAKRPDWAAGIRAAWKTGELAATHQLERFIASGLIEYRADRDFPQRRGTSRLSPYLRFGEIAVNRVWRTVQSAADENLISEGECLAYQRQLAWREFSWHLLFHFTGIERENFRSIFDTFAWRDDPAALRRWQAGETGYPLVDAGMRELWQTGWMHNRVRMVAASFLTKHLRIDWRHGEAWFWDTLVDADPANNPVSWQWVAGSGADAAPYFRVFNPAAQAKRYDPNGAYIRQWVPEIAALPDSHIHQPHLASESVLSAAGVVLGKTYSAPIVDHAAARAAALEAFAALRR